MANRKEQDGLTAVQPEQDKTMERLAEILEGEGVEVHRFSDEQEQPVIVLQCDEGTSKRAAEIATGLGYELVRTGHFRRYPKGKPYLPYWRLSFSSTSA